MNATESALNEIASRPHINLGQLRKNNTVLVNAVASLYEITIVDPEHGLVAVYGSDQKFQGRRPVVAGYLGAWLSKDKGLEVKDRIIKGMRMAFQFADAVYVTEPVDSAAVHGKGWHYEAITE